MPVLSTASPNSLDHRELEARSQDIVAVFNPLEKTVYTYWDTNRIFTFPAKQVTQVPRYIGVKYIEESINRYCMEKANQAVKEEDLDRVTKRKLDKMTSREVEEFSRAMMPDRLSEEDRLIIFKDLFRGTISRYGDGMPPLEEQLNPRPVITDTMTLMNELETFETLKELEPVVANPSEAALGDML